MYPIRRLAPLLALLFVGAAAAQDACEFTPLESITAATQNGARVLGIEARTGTVRIGLEADLIAVERDPLADATALFEPLLVVRDGRVVAERPL